MSVRTMRGAQATAASPDGQTEDLFELSLQRLVADRPLPGVVMLLFGLLALALWAAWLLLAPVPLVVASLQASLERDGEPARPRQIQSPLIGRVVRAQLTLGATVRRGDVIAELDTSQQMLQKDQTSARLAGLDGQRMHLRNRIAYDEQAKRRAAAAIAAQSAESEGLLDDAIADAAAAGAESRRTEALLQSGMVSRRALDEARARDLRATARLTTARATGIRLREEAATQARERDARLEQSRAELAAMESQQTHLKAELATLDGEVERRRIRAPIDGHIAEMRPLREGAVLLEGQHLATITPAWPSATPPPLRLVAQFDPGDAIGHVRPGLAARFIPDAAPWTRRNGVDALVTQVADELQDGRVRVELTVRSTDTASDLPALVHGLPGQVQVHLGARTPWDLLTRAVGRIESTVTR